MRDRFVLLTTDIAPAPIHPIARLSIVTAKPQCADTSNEFFDHNASSWRKCIDEVL
jgi:hypothetical protein